MIKRKKFLVTLIPLALLILIILIINNREIPLNPPTPAISCHGDKINLSEADHTWFNKDNGGNSCIFGSPYDIGKKMNSFIAEPESKINFSFKGKPKSIKVLFWTGYDKSTIYKNYTNNNNKGEIIVPKKEGEYIMELVGQWDESHTTSHVFKIKVSDTL